MTSARGRAVVIGAGLGGLAVAIRLLASGMEVQVVEAQPTPGGRAGRISAMGHTFDTGPSLLTLPRLLEELFELGGASLSDELILRRLEPFYRIHWRGESRSLDFSGDRELLAEQIAKFSQEDARRLPAFLEASRRIYEEGILAAGGRPFLHRRDLAPLVPSMLQLGAVRSVEHFVHRFFREPHVRQAFAFHPLFIGGDPFRVPAVYAALAYLQIDEGVWYVEGGMHELVLALSRVVERRGEIRLGEGVRRIQTDGGRVRGVVTTEGEFLPAEVVVSNADVVATQRELLGRRQLVPSRLSMSCYLLHLGLETRYPRLAHHTLLVGEDYPAFVRDVTRRGRLGQSPSLYLHSPTASDPRMAPPGGDSLTVLLPVPNLSSRQVDWARDGAGVRESVLAALESPTGLGLEGLRERIRLERAWTPLDFQQELGAVDGNAFGPEPVLLQSASFRQPNRDRRIDGLYYVGAGTHPGAGIPGVLMGAAITARLVVEG